MVVYLHLKEKKEKYLQVFDEFLFDKCRDGHEKHLPMRIPISFSDH